MNSHLILVRHSLPEIEKDRPAREWSLSVAGQERAHRLAERLSSYSFGSLVSSVEPKARKTAQIIAERCGVCLQAVEGLHEHDRSNVPYLSNVEFETAVRELFNHPDRLVFGSETANEAHERFAQAVYSVLSGLESDTTVIVSHGTVISLFVSRLTGQPDLRIWRDLGLPGFVLLDRKSNTLLHLENIL